MAKMVGMDVAGEDWPVTKYDGCGKCLIGAVRLSRKSDSTDSLEKSSASRARPGNGARHHRPHHPRRRSPAGSRPLAGLRVNASEPIASGPDLRRAVSPLGVI